MVNICKYKQKFQKEIMTLLTGSPFLLDQKKIELKNLKIKKVDQLEYS